MPTYQYQCKACGHQLEEFQSMSEAPLTLCPHCGTENLARVMGTGAGVIFKGSGFYLTDYKNVAKKTDAGSGKTTPPATPPPQESTPKEKPKDKSS